MLSACGFAALLEHPASVARALLPDAVLRRAFMGLAMAATAIAIIYSVASAVPAGVWTAGWVYVTAPLAGMLLAAECHLRAAGAHRVFCAKLHHGHDGPCHLRCTWDPLATPSR